MVCCCGTETKIIAALFIAQTHMYHSAEEIYVIAAEFQTSVSELTPSHNG